MLQVYQRKMRNSAARLRNAPPGSAHCSVHKPIRSYAKLQQAAEKFVGRCAIVIYEVANIAASCFLCDPHTIMWTQGDAKPERENLHADIVTLQ